MNVDQVIDMTITPGEKCDVQKTSQTLSGMGKILRDFRPQNDVENPVKKSRKMIMSDDASS